MYRFCWVYHHMLTSWLLHLPVTLVLSDKDFSDLVSGKANAQRLFMGGKLKIRGNIMKATKMEPILKKAQTKAKL
jgi:putative sterol carrier protein